VLQSTASFLYWVSDCCERGSKPRRTVREHKALATPKGGKLALSLTDAISPYRTVLTQSQSNHGRCGGAYQRKVQTEERSRLQIRWCGTENYAPNQYLVLGR
jgi:hypothetical protein